MFENLVGAELEGCSQVCGDVNAATQGRGPRGPRGTASTLGCLRLLQCIVPW